MCSYYCGTKRPIGELLLLDSPTLVSELEEAAAVLESTLGMVGSATLIDTPWWYSRRTVAPVGNEREARRQHVCVIWLRIEERLTNSPTGLTTVPNWEKNFSGLTTNWEDLLKVVSWHETVFARLPEHQAFASEVRIALMTLPATRLKSLLLSTLEVFPVLKSWNVR